MYIYLCNSESLDWAIRHMQTCGWRTAVQFSKNEWFCLHCPISINHTFPASKFLCPQILSQPVHVPLFYYITTLCTLCESGGGKMRNLCSIYKIINYIIWIAPVVKVYMGSVISEASGIKLACFPIVIMKMCGLQPSPFLKVDVFAFPLFL